MQDFIGRTLDNYRIVEKIGEGGTGEVCLAADAVLDWRIFFKRKLEEGDPQMRKTVMRVLVVIFMIAVVVTFSTPLFAQDDGIPLVPLVDPIPFEDLDLNGIWNFRTTQPTVSGACPAGSAVAGTAAITQNGNAVTLKYVSGAKCNPAAVCSYDGTLDEEENQFVVANSVTVDGEGGTLSSAIRLTVYNNELANGNGTNHYVHPKGFECRWNMNVVFTRELEEDEE